MNRNASWIALTDVLRRLSPATLLAIQDNEAAFLAHMDGFVLELVKGIFVFPVDDKDALPHEKDAVSYMRERNRKEHPDYQGPNLWSVKTGMNFRLHGPSLGLPLYNGWSYLQDWSLRNDENTEACRVLWTPRLVEGSKSKTPQEQMDVLAANYKKWKLPELNRDRPFGSVSLLTGLIAAHWKRTNGAERVPLNFDYASTDTLYSVGDRLVLGYFDGRGLNCNNWNENRNDNVGCFPAMIGKEIKKAQCLLLCLQTFHPTAEHFPNVVH